MRTANAQPTSRRPAFVFLIVLLLLVVAITIIGGGLTRTVMQARAAEMQLDAYRRHHEMLGVRDTVFTFLRNKTTDEITAIAASGKDAQRIELDDGVTMRMTIADGQGKLLLTNVDEIDNKGDREWLIKALRYLPADRYHELTRRAGPIRLSLRGTPDEVLYAATHADDQLTAALITARGDDLQSQAQLIQALRRSGVDAQLSMDIAARFDFDSKIWLLQVEAFHPELSRGFRYDVTAELGTIPRIYDWRLVN
jgi:type II secretory pathway component PulK